MFQDLTPNWETLAYDERNAVRAGPMISFYGEKMTFNALFLKEQQVAKALFVNMRFAANTRQIAIQFHSDNERHGRKNIIRAKKSLTPRPKADAEANKVAGKKLDGRGRKITGAHKIGAVFVKCGMLIKTVTWIREAVTRGEGQGVARYTPVYDPLSDSWIITLAPLLCARTPVAEYRQHIARTNRLGVYVFYNAEEQVIYIGEGNLDSRMRDHLVRPVGAEIFYVAWVELDDKQACRAFEHELLEQYELAHAKLPQFNKQRGYRSSKIV